MRCIYCNAEDLENDDNFCYNCGHWTIKGYNYLNNENNVKNILSGDAIKTENRFFITLGLLAISLILFLAMILIRGADLFKPFTYLKKQAVNYIYGYKTSTIKTDNKYSKKNISTYNDAVDIIKRDFDDQRWLCASDIDVGRVELKLEKEHHIPSVSFCDMSISETEKIESVIDDVYSLFPSISGALTNITITNASSNSEYIARFQPMYQFVNINEDISYFNKVNKTQILLNSYYFLNDKMLSNKLENIVGEDWYVKDATFESTIAHELGHYISFVVLLKDNDIDNITFVTYSNYKKIDKLLGTFNNGLFSKQIINEALDNYNIKYGTQLDNFSFAKSISKYASSKDDSGNLISDETIAEAIHDYYLHGNNMSKSSYEIIKVLKRRLGEV